MTGRAKSKNEASIEERHLKDGEREKLVSYLTAEAEAILECSMNQLLHLSIQPLIFPKPVSVGISRFTCRRKQ